MCSSRQMSGLHFSFCSSATDTSIQVSRLRAEMYLAVFSKEFINSYYVARLFVWFFSPSAGVQLLWYFGELVVWDYLLSLPAVFYHVGNLHRDSACLQEIGRF